MIKMQIAGFLSSFQWIAQRWCNGFAMLQESKAIARILRKALQRGTSSSALHEGGHCSVTYILLLSVIFDQDIGYSMPHFILFQ